MKRVLLTTMQRDVLEQAHCPTRHHCNYTKYRREAPPLLSEESKYRFVSQPSAAGLAVRIKHGLYQIGDISSLGTLTISPYTVAQLLHPEVLMSDFKPHYIFMGCLISRLRSVSLQPPPNRKPAQKCRARADSYVKTKADYFFGFTREAFDGQWVQISPEAEKAVIDLMQVSPLPAPRLTWLSRFCADNHHNVDLDRLVTYALRSPVAVQRTLGFLLDSCTWAENNYIRPSNRVPA
jgi:hypothetical protein